MLVLFVMFEYIHEGNKFKGGKVVLRRNLSKKPNPCLHKDNQNYKNQTSKPMVGIRLKLRTYRIPALSITSWTLAMAFNSYNSVKLRLYRSFLRNLSF